LFPPPASQGNSFSMAAFLARAFLLASFLGMVASQCTDAEMCATADFVFDAVIGYTCSSVAGDGTPTVFGNTLDPDCLAGAQSCQEGTVPILTAEDCASPRYWVPTTCDGVKENTAPANCPFIQPAILANYAIDYGGADACCLVVDDDEPCFPGTAIVTKADGTSSRVDALKEGDQIVAAAADGSLTTDTVSLLSIAHPEAIVDKFITLSTAAGASLTLTPNHHLPVGPTCCSTLKMAKDVRIGEVVYTVAEGKTTTTSVIGMHVTKATGLHSPVLTNGNFPVVDSFVTSFDSIDKVTLAKHGLASLVTACKTSGTCETLRHIFMGEDLTLV